MRIAVGVGAVNDGTVHGCIDYCKALQIDRVVLNAGAVPGYTQTRLLDLAALKAQKTEIEKAGLSTSTLQFWPPYPLGEGANVQAQIDSLTRSMDVLAEAGIGTFSMFINLPKPVDPAEEEGQWETVTGFYRKLCSEAEQRGIRVATHFSGHTGRSIVAGANAYRRLFKEVPAANNGLTFCVGNVWVSDGVRINNIIREFKDRIFFVHMRSTKISWGESPYWWDIKDGPDMRQIFQTLKEIGYQGDLGYEHMPEIPGENRQDISAAWAIGYMKALLQYL